VPFVRRKKIDGNWYCYLVSSERVNGKVKQRTLAYLGKHATVEAAYEHWHRESKKPGKKTHATMMLRRLQQYL
jgi:AP2 domain